jgi:hypothetical protein
MPVLLIAANPFAPQKTIFLLLVCLLVLLVRVENCTILLIHYTVNTV